MCNNFFFKQAILFHPAKKTKAQVYILYIYLNYTTQQRQKKKEGKIEREMTKSENLIINNNPIASISRQTFLV